MNPAPAIQTWQTRLSTADPLLLPLLQASEHRNVQQIFPFATQGIFKSAPGEDWPTHTFIVWLELMVRSVPWPARPAANRQPPLLSEGCAAGAAPQR